jgi:hypothetical protein
MTARHPFAVKIESEREAREALERQEASEAGELLSERLRLQKQEHEIEEIQIGAARPHATAQSTIDAYWYLRNYAPQRLAAWLEDHPLDSAFLSGLKKGTGT